jgi:hypothetical protein
MGGCCGKPKKRAAAGDPGGDDPAADQVYDELAGLGPEEKVPMFALSGVRLIRVVKVYDGDTVHVALKVDGELTRFRVRILGQDAPEVTGADKAFGVAVREVAKALADQKIAYVDFGEGKVGKFGRPLGRLYLRREPGGVKTEMAVGPRRVRVPATADVERGEPAPTAEELEISAGLTGGSWIQLTAFLLEHRLTKPYDGRGARGYSESELAGFVAEF